MNSGAIRKNLFSFYLVELSRNWVEVTLISWSALPPTLFLSPFLSLSLSFSLSTAGSWNITAAFSPRSKADALPIPASSTDCHSSCQSNAIYLGAQRLLKRGRSKGWRDVMKGWERAGEKKQKGEAEKVRWGCFFFFFIICGWGTGCIWNFHISNEESRETGQRKTESWVCFSCWPSLIFSWLLAGRVHQTWGGCGSSWAGNEEVFWQPLYPVLTLLSHPLLINTSLHCQKPLICK